MCNQVEIENIFFKIIEFFFKNTANDINANDRNESIRSIDLFSNYRGMMPIAN